MDRYGTVGAVIAAAGSSSRMGGRDKLAEPLDGIPVILRTLAAVEAVPEIREIVVVTREDRVEEYRRLLGQCSRLRAVVPGGSTRQESVRNGVRALSPDCTLAAIHDGARPFVTPEIIARAYEDVVKWKACVVGMPVKDTIKLVDEDSCIVDSPRRSLVWQAQTPQVFSVPLIAEAFTRQMKEDCSHVTDDAMVVEAQMGVRIHMTQGSYENIKITTPEDLLIAETMLNKKS